MNWNAVLIALGVAVLVACLIGIGIAIWAARGDFYDEQVTDEIRELRDAAEEFFISGVGLPVEPEPWPEGVTKVRAKDLDGRTWEFARVDAQVRVREVEPR